MSRSPGSLAAVNGHLVHKLRQESGRGRLALGGDGAGQRPGPTVLLPADGHPELPHPWPNEAHRAGSFACPLAPRRFAASIAPSRRRWSTRTQAGFVAQVSTRWSDDSAPCASSQATRCAVMFDVADLHPARPTLGVDAAKPEVMLARAVDLTLKPRRKVFRLSTHALRVSVRCIERRIWVETPPVSVRYAESRSASALNWAFECAPRDLNPKPAD